MTEPRPAPTGSPQDPLCTVCRYNRVPKAVRPASPWPPVCDSCQRSNQSHVLSPRRDEHDGTEIICENCGRSTTGDLRWVWEDEDREKVVCSICYALGQPKRYEEVR